MKQGAVLALDLATTTGWAWHRPGMPRPFFGAFKLPGSPKAVGEPCDALERWLRQLFIDLRPGGGISHFFFEAQHLGSVGGQTFTDANTGRKVKAGGSINLETVYRLIGLGATVEKFAFQVNGRAYQTEVATWRKHFLGRGSGFKRDQTKPGKVKPYLPGEDPKELAIQRCATYGWHTDVADAAEALGILDYALTLIPDYQRPWRDYALLGGGR